ncbi:MAG: hypothetical protein AUJ07_01630 [Crenarchaeota archaeon 13_1_40CM_3_53_5]|nr:MAG: hypothetical protein AUJ07_01630 [Crenarchaeota archaeon 13_1_40CM_3_53_5]
MALFAARIVVLILAMVIARAERPKKTSRGKSKRVYSKSERNAIIDSIIHPWADEHWSFVIVDGILHAFNEKDPVQSLIKFLRYNAPELLKRILKEIR